MHSLYHQKYAAPHDLHGFPSPEETSGDFVFLRQIVLGPARVQLQGHQLSESIFLRRFIS
jgi:hypothetical protein